MATSGFKSVVLEDVSCPNGCRRDDETVLTANDLLSGLPGEFTVVRCKQCSLMRTNPRPTAETIGFYYPDNYGPYVGTLVSDRTKIQPKWKHWVKRLFSTKSTLLPNIAPGRMLEVGCASGGFLHDMAEAGWQVEGIEFSDSAADNARRDGYKVHTGTLETAPDPDKKFDLIVAWMVLEHLHEPLLSLQKLSDWTKKDGYFAFSIPNSSSFFFNRYSYNLQLPTHLYHFTPETITALLSKSGWTVENISQQITLSSLLASIGYWLRETRGESKVSQWLVNYPTRGGKLHYVLYPLAYLLAIFGQSGRMTILVRKQG